MSNLIPVNFNNEIVITTKMLAEVYECEDVNISNNFKRNEDKFEEGKHYYKLTGKELKEFKGYHQNDESLKFVSILYLWTKRGASRHCKMLGTDKAWDMFDSLEENYFNPKVPQLTRKQELQLAILNGSELERTVALKQYEELIAQPFIEHIDEIQPKADKYKQFMDTDGTFGFRELCKHLNGLGYSLKETELRTILKDNNIICKQGRKYVVTQEGVREGYGILKDNLVNNTNRPTTRYTEKLRDYLIKKLA